MADMDSSEKRSFIDNSNNSVNPQPPPYSGPGGYYQPAQPAAPGFHPDGSYPQQPYPPGPGFGFGMPPPQPYNAAQPNQGGQSDVTESILAAQAVTAAIKQNGRNPVTVVCPTCKSTGITQITEVENPSVTRGASAVMPMFFGGAAVVFLAFFVIAAVVSGSLIPLGIMPVFLLFLLVGFCVMRRATAAAAAMCKDIQHHCAVCKTLLGVSSGEEVMREMQRLNRRHRRSF